MLVRDTRLGQTVAITTGTTKSHSLRTRIGVIVDYGHTDIGPGHYVLTAIVELPGGETVEDTRVAAPTASVPA